MNGNYEDGTSDQARFTGAKQKKYGLLEVKVGSNHIVRTRDRVKRQVRVRDLGKYRDLTCVCVCLSCGKEYKDEYDLQSQHDDEHKMFLEEQVHVWGYWSEEPADRPPMLEPTDTHETDDKPKKKKADEGAQGATANVDYGNILGLLSNNR